MDTIRSLINLLMLLTCYLMYLRKLFLDHPPMIIVVSGYTCARKGSIENPDHRDCVPNSLCNNPRHSSLKESVPNLSNLIVI